MSKRNSVVAVVILALGASSTMGCKKLVQRALRVDAGAPVVADLPGTTSEHDMIGDKLHNYIDCFNQVDGAIGRSMSRYKSWMADSEKGPTGKERSVYGLYDVSATSVATCKKGIPAGAKQKPPIPSLETSGQEYLAAVEELAPKIAEAYKYYDRKDYADDKFVKGISMHGPLMTAYKRFAKASEAFSDAIESENGKYLDAELQQVEAKYGKKLLWHKMTLGRDAKELMHVLEKDGFDVSKAEILVAKFTEHVDATTAYAAAHKDEQPTLWSLYESRTKSVLDAFKSRMRRVRDKQAFSTGEQMLMRNGSPELVSGTIAKCSKEYNALVDAGNSLKFKL